MKKEEKIKKSRAWVYTIHNYSTEDLQKFHTLADSLNKHRYICYGLETGENKETPHIQGYIQLNEAKPFQFLHKYFDFKKDGKLVKFHCEIAIADVDYQKKYTSKEGDWYEYGEPVKQGQRADLKLIKEEVEKTPHEVSRIVREHGNNYQQIKFAETLSKHYFSEHRDPKNPPKVYWIFGSSGIGKTKIVHDTFDDVCVVSIFRWPGTNYTQNECILFDDFRPEEMPFTHVLRITDRYKCTLEKKGGEIPLNSPYIIFTSPSDISESYKGLRENLRQLKRRVVQINLDEWKLDIDNIDLRNLNEKYIHKGFIHPKDIF